MGYYFAEYSKEGEEKPIFVAFGTENEHVWKMDDIVHLTHKGILSENDLRKYDYDDIKRRGEVQVKEKAFQKYTKKVKYLGENLDEIINFAKKDRTLEILINEYIEKLSNE